MALEKLYTISEAAQYLRVSKWAIEAWLKQGKLRRTKAGARTVIRERELERFLCDEPPLGAREAKEVDHARA